jgi:hypothetical protein
MLFLVHFINSGYHRHVQWTVSEVVITDCHRHVHWTVSEFVITN